MDKDAPSLTPADKVIKAATSDGAHVDTHVHLDAAAVVAEAKKATETERIEAERCSALELAKVNNEAALRTSALWLCSAATVIILLAQIVFAWNGKILPIPDIIWVVVLAPWLGAGSSKVVDIISRIFIRSR